MIMTLADMIEALKGLGKQLWVSAELGLANTTQPTSRECCFDLPLQRRDSSLWSDWTNLEVDPHHYGPPWVIAVPDEQGRILDWEQSCLEAAVSLTSDINSNPFNELAQAIGLHLVQSRDPS